MTKSSSSTTSSTASPPKDIEQQGAAAATTTEATTTTTNAMKGKRRRIVFISLTVGVLVAVCVIVGLSVASSKKASALGEDGSDSGGGFLSNLFVKAQCTEPCVPGSEDIMDPKSHGTSEYPVQNPLRWDCDFETADRISNFNRHKAEYSGYWLSTTFPMDNEDGEPITFYDSGWKGSPLYTAPQDRTWDEFISESKKHGWPSFRDSEVNWDYVRVLPGGEMVSIDGTHLGHNLPDKKGNRYCINLTTIAGIPITDEKNNTSY